MRPYARADIVVAMTRHSLGSDGPGDHADRGADIGAGCGLLVLELALLVVIFGAWLLTGVSLDPAEQGGTAPLSGYLPWAGGVGLLAFVATVIAARAKAVITVIGQGFMAVLVAVVIAGGWRRSVMRTDSTRPPRSDRTRSWAAAAGATAGSAPGPAAERAGARASGGPRGQPPASRDAPSGVRLWSTEEPVRTVVTRPAPRRTPAC